MKAYVTLVRYDGGFKLTYELSDGTLSACRVDRTFAWLLGAVLRNLGAFLSGESYSLYLPLYARGEEPALTEVPIQDQYLTCQLEATQLNIESPYYFDPRQPWEIRIIPKGENDDR